MRGVLKFLLTLFSVLALVAVGVLSVERFLESRSGGSGPVADEELVIPECKRPSLEIGTRDQFGLMLSKLAASGGLEAVKNYVEVEILPGRTLMTADSSSEPVSGRRVLDRELRHQDPEGVVPLGKPPLVPRASSELKAGRRVQIQSWTRQEGLEPFVLTIWWVADESP